MPWNWALVEWLICNKAYENNWVLCEWYISLYNPDGLSFSLSVGATLVNGHTLSDLIRILKKQTEIFPLVLCHSTTTLGPKKVSGFWSVHASPQRVGIFYFLFFLYYETMSSCSQNCWIDWNSVVLCFKRLFHIWVWTFAQFVRPLLATILYIWEIWAPHTQCITYFPAWQKNDFEADRWPETGDFFGGP